MGKTTLKSMTLTSKEKVNELQSGVLYFIDEGKEVRIFEENALPIASSRLLGNIYRYTGETTNEYKNGAFYNVIKFGENYSWREVYGLNLDLNLDPKTDNDTVEVHFDSTTGKLYCAGGNIESAENIKVSNRSEFPNIGEKNKIYIAKDEGKIYFFDIEKNNYICIGNNYENIKIINGGDANATTNTN